MFKVANADFIADKLAQELLPDQEFREVAKNAEEAIYRRMQATGTQGGRIEIDVDWSMLVESGNWYICCADDGDGMDRAQLERYTTTLAVQGAGDNQSLTGNQGMGLKISGPTRHKEGVLIRSMKNGERTMVQIGWNKETREYGLLPLGPRGETLVSVAADFFPDYIVNRGSGTVVTFLGNFENDNTVWPASRRKNWLFKYLNQRFFRFGHDGIELMVRQPSGEVSDWPTTRDEAGLGKSFNLATVKGTATVWDDAADHGGEKKRSHVDLPGDPAADIPAARIHWWILPEGTGSDPTTRTAGGGSLAVLFQNELHDWRTSNQANPYFARMGVLFGKNRITFVIEPLGTTIASDFARAHVLVGGKPLFESDAWLLWSEQFRVRMPEPIKATMHEEQARLQVENPDRARRIQDRLKDVLALLRPQRFRIKGTGTVRATGPTASGAGGGEGSSIERSAGEGRKRGAAPSTKGIGALLTQASEDDGEPSTEVFSILRLEPIWVTESEAETMPIVNGNGNGPGIHDRAAALVGEDGVRAGTLLLNLQFRGYQAILSAVNEWANPEGDDLKAQRIVQYTQEWIEQKMVEAVNGLRQLENGSTWTPSNYDDALSPVALTAAFMADRYHTLREVRRQVGSMRTDPAPAGA